MNRTTTVQTPRRREIFSPATLIAAGAVAAAMVFPEHALAVKPPLKFSNIPGTGDIQVLNYALALEDLEADLYAQALMRLTSGGTNDIGVTITGLGLSSSEPDVSYVNEFGTVETEHAAFLRAAITAAGGTPITKYNHDFKIQDKSRQQVDQLIYDAEHIGVTAYLGAIPLLTTQSPYLQVAGGIEGVEARHTAVIASTINTLFKDKNIQVAPPARDHHAADQPATPDKVLREVSPYIVTS